MNFTFNKFYFVVACEGLSLTNGSVSYQVPSWATYPQGNAFPVGTTAAFSCSDGYSLFGAPRLICQQSRNWATLDWSTSQLAPTCKGK